MDLVSPPRPEGETPEAEDGERRSRGLTRSTRDKTGAGFSSGRCSPQKRVTARRSASASSASSAQGRPRAPPPRVPDDVVAVAPVELLPVLARAVHHADARHEVHDLLGRRVVEVVAALVAPVAVHPLEPQVAARGAPGGHVGAPTPRLRLGPAAGRRKPSDRRPGLAACRVL